MLITDTLSNEDTILPQLRINFEYPNDWSENIITLQKLYLDKHELNSPPRAFNETIELLKNYARTSLMLENEKSIEALVWASIGLLEIYLLAQNPQITELFLTKIGSAIFINHHEYGRCKTDLFFTENLWYAIKNRVEFETGQALTPLSPALKVGLVSSIGALRISIQVEPLSPEGPTMNIRRLPSKPITLESLVSQGQLSNRISELLMDSLNQRKNIIIAGEPASGKTTLANSLLLNVDPTWRLIVIEDARELIIDHNNHPLTTRFSMPSVGADSRYSQRANEIARLLHRSPDYVFLGEIQNKDDSLATFEGFAAGLRGIATTHGKNLESLLSRWTNSHGMPYQLLSSIDLIVFTRRIFHDGKIDLKADKVYCRKEGIRFDGFSEVMELGS